MRIAALPVLCAVIAHGLDAPAPAPAPGSGVILAHEPTLSPRRRRNYTPVISPTEKQHEEDGADIQQRDCVRTPALSMCNCVEMINACRVATVECDDMLMDSQEHMDKAERQNYVSKFDHPLLNTLQMPSPRCQKCFQQISKSADWSERPPSFLQNAPTTAEFGYRIFDESPDWQSIMRGRCTLSEIQGLQECLSYFWACDGNRERIRNYLKNTERETEYVYTHPGTRPGIH